MKRIIVPVLILLITPLCLNAATSSPSINSSGWTVSVSEGGDSLNVSKDSLGILLRDIRFFRKQSEGLSELKGWSVEVEGANQLQISTTQPRSTWVFKVENDILRIATTEPEGVILAKAPASPDRVVARLMDDRGTPVDWRGTGEVAEGYGGSYTHNRSFLPESNAETMFFGLGQVSGRTFHSLFDRNTDTAIAFEDGAEMNREPGNDEVLDISMQVPGNASIHTIQDYYVKSLGVPFYAKFDDSYFRSAPMVWSSWTSYYEAVTEQDVVRNADWLADHLKPYGFQYVQLDDGYDRGSQGEHFWIENWDRAKFPHGPEWLANQIRSRGLKAGIWLVPNSYAGAVAQHPDWYLYDKQGKNLTDYSTPALDSTNPHAIELENHILATLDGWGFDYYKFDGENALPKYAPPVDLSRLHDPSADLLANYRDRLKSFRETIGPKRFIEMCPAGTPLNGIGYANSYFNGDDLYNNWQGMYSLFSSINANAFLNHLLVYVMPGEGLELGEPMTMEQAMKLRPRVVIETEKDRENPPTGFGTTMAEARTLVSYVSLTGVAYPLASVMPELPAERVKLLQATMPTLPIVPVDLFSRGTETAWDLFKKVRADDYIHNYPEILDLKINAPAGIYDAVGLTNWRSWTAAKNVSFESELGLDPHEQYVVFDFWNQKVLGIFRGDMTVEVEPHDTRVLLVHPLADHPQVVGTSRHITGAYSILAQEWDASRHTLSGSSQTVAGDPYSVWVRFPPELAVRIIQAKSRAGTTIEAKFQAWGSVLRVSFMGQSDVVDWKIQFAEKH